MKWYLREERTGNPLTDLHQFDFGQVSSLFDGQDPSEATTYSTRANTVVSSFTPTHRDELVGTLRVYMEELGASSTSLQLLDKLRDSRSVAVVTGQQAGLFGGPLYTLYKAMSAIGMAKRLEARLERPVVPVFWIASEDHDWGEVDHAYLLDPTDDVQRLKLKHTPEPHQMVFATQLNEAAVQDVIQHAQQTLPDGPEKQRVIQTMTDTFAPGMSMATWFAKILVKMVEPHGMVFLDPCLPGLRQLVLPVWQNALRNHEEVGVSLAAAYEEVQARGFTPAVVRDESNTTLFYVEHGKRFVLERTGHDTLRARGHGLEQSVDEWLCMAEANPSSFSSNVLLRPVVQDTLLPTVAYVGGPAEIAYHSLSRGVFHAHGRTLPPLFHRDRVLLIPPSVQRAMVKWGVGNVHATKVQNVTQTALRDLGGRELELEFGRMVESVMTRWRAWESTVTHLGPQVSAMAEAQAQREVAGLQRLQEKTMRLLALQHDAEVKQLRHIERWLWTDGYPQERRLCPLNVWSKYGLTWLTGLPFWGDFEAPSGVHHVEV